MKQFVSLLFVVIAFFWHLPSDAQLAERFYNQEMHEFIITNNAENIYVHTDRDVYSTNDTIWFKIYTINVHSKLPVADYRNVYVELINEQEELVLRNLILCNNGYGSSDFNLSNHTIKKGKYKLRAYTQFQRNFGDALFFEKNMLINKLIEKQEDIEIDETANLMVKENKVDFQLMPEGGILAYGVNNTLAFKAIGENGLSVEVSGWIQDDNGDNVVPIQTSHAGMGKVGFTPSEGKSYSIVLSNDLNTHYDVPIETNRVVMTVEDVNDSILFVWLKDIKVKDFSNEYFLYCTSQGVNHFSFPIKMDKPILKYALKKMAFGTGVNTITLVDKEHKPLLERRVFIKKEGFLSLSAKTDKEIYLNKEKVSVKVTAFHEELPKEANLSVSVINVKQVVPLELYPQNMLSSIFLESEIKGYIENASYYFKDDSVSTSEKLDLLMLTQGWSQYVWNDVQLSDSLFEPEIGLDLNGRVKKLFYKKGSKNTDVSLFVQNNEGFKYSDVTKTNNKGEFHFSQCYIPDTAHVFLQALNSRGHSNTEFEYIETFRSTPPINLNFELFSIPSKRSLSKFDEMAYRRLATDKAYNPEKYEILLDEVAVTRARLRKQKESDFTIYGDADHVVVNDDRVAYRNVWDLIRGKVPGVTINGRVDKNPSITIRGISSIGAGTKPLFMLDGFSVDVDALSSLPITSVDRVEVLKNIGSTGMFGASGANGVIAVYTKSGVVSKGLDHQNGVLSEQVRGYSSSRKFYSPHYTVKKNSIPDHRATIYWNPTLKTDATGVAEFSFFTSDDSAPVLISIEGNTSDGKIGVVNTYFLMGDRM